jgi:hypothetical protein
VRRARGQFVPLRRSVVDVLEISYDRRAASHAVALPHHQ